MTEDKIGKQLQQALSRLLEAPDVLSKSSAEQKIALEKLKELKSSSIKGLPPAYDLLHSCFIIVQNELDKFAVKSEAVDGLDFRDTQCVDTHTRIFERLLKINREIKGSSNLEALSDGALEILAEKTGSISAVVQPCCDGLVFVKLVGFRIAADAMMACVLSREHRDSRRAAERSRHKAVLKRDPVLREISDHWHVLNRVEPLVICVDQHDVGSDPRTRREGGFRYK